MTGILARGADFLARQLGGPQPGVLYLPVGWPSAFALTAWAGGQRQVQLQGLNLPGVRLDAAERDFLFRVVDLQYPTGVRYSPRRGDRVTEVINGVTTTWEVTPTEAGPCWSPADHTNVLVRVHTKRVA